jgi:predicted DNA-binding protein
MKKPNLKYAKRASGSGNYKQISARVPEELYNRFQKVSEVAQREGYEIVLTEVICIAMRETIDEMTRELGEEAFQLDFFDSTKDDVSNIEDGSKDATKKGSKPAKKGGAELDAKRTTASLTTASLPAEKPPVQP